MEFPDVGKNCDVASCNQLDFLPFQCNSCGGTFCLQHKSKDDHQCIQTEDRPTKFSGEKSYSCSVNGCCKREQTQILCPLCNDNFCLSHRLQEDHSCPKLPEKKPDVSQTTQHVQGIMAKKEFKAKSKPTTPKAIQMAAKINLMKLKGRAQGDSGIPQTERIYFKIILPLESGKPPAEIFFSKLWSVGRTIDVIADRSSITNNNNTSCEKKLRLFHAHTGNLLQTDLSLNEILADEASLLMNGSSLVLERVADDVTILDCLEQYQS